MADKLRITLVRSPIACRRQHRRTVRALGLTRIGQQVEHDAVPDIRGMVDIVAYMLKVEEINK